MTNEQRVDFDVITDIVPAGATVLDLGCGDGSLLARLVEQKQIEARGVEISETKVRAAIARGLSVRHGNIEEGLADYREHAFEYVILSQTLAYLNEPEPVMRELLRVGKHAIVSLNNAGYWRERLRALLGHGMGNTLCSGEPRVRAITLDQFLHFSASVNARVERTVFVSGRHPVGCLPSLRANVAVYVLTRV